MSINLKPLIGFLFLVTCVFIGGALLGGFSYIQSGSPDTFSISKFITYSTLFLGLLSCYIYLKWCRIDLKDGFGFSTGDDSFILLAFKGWAIGTGVMVLLVVFYLVTGLYIAEPELETSFINLLIIFLKAFLSGWVIAIIEESIFRGALLSGLKKHGNIILAIAITSLFYAAVHFIKYNPQDINRMESWSSGLSYLPGAFYRFSDPAIFDSFLTLTILGVLFSLARLKSGNIAEAIGIHAGIVMVMKITRDLTDYRHGNQLDYLVNRYDHITGVFAFAWLLIICVIYYQIYKNSINRATA